MQSWRPFQFGTLRRVQTSDSHRHGCIESLEDFLRKSAIHIDDPVGFIYIIKARGLKIYKIGFSSTIRSAIGRVNLFQKGSPVALYIVGLIPKRNTRDEKYQHKLMRDHLIHGEWFAENQLIGKLIKNFPATKFIELDCESDCKFL